MKSTNFVVLLILRRSFRLTNVHNCTKICLQDGSHFSPVTKSIAGRNERYNKKQNPIFVSSFLFSCVEVSPWDEEFPNIKQKVMRKITCTGQYFLYCSRLTLVHQTSFTVCDLLYLLYSKY